MGGGGGGGVESDGVGNSVPLPSSHHGGLFYGLLMGVEIDSYLSLENRAA